MRKPNPIVEDKSMETFESVHESMRRGANSGTVEPGGGRVDGGAVFLKGTVVYARYGEETAEDALESLFSEVGNGVRASLSDTEKVKMYRTYLRYISDDGLITAEPLDGVTVEQHDVEGVVVEGVRNVRKGSWRGETNTADRSFFPKGRRTALAPDFGSLREHVAENGVSGYAVGTHEVVTFRNGEIIDRKGVFVEPSVREEVGAGDGWVVVDSDPADETAAEDEKEDEGILSRLF
ncbi:MAG: hypothetical protein U5J64_01135 [Halobacteriales archaeon]|nr:hypothetical protein [Halobacteriales archaeon]